jgi:hypothetical protein
MNSERDIIGIVDSTFYDDDSPLCEKTRGEPSKKSRPTVMTDDRLDLILRLRREKQAALAASDFNKAQVISQQLGVLYSQAKPTSSAPRTPSPRKIPGAYHENYLASIGSHEQQLSAALEEIHTHFQSAYADVEKRYQALLEERAQEHEIAMKREAARLNPRVVELREHARLVGKNEDFEGARRSQKEADMMQDRIIEKRKQQLIAEYEQVNANLLEKKEAALKVLEAREIEEMTERYRKLRRSEQAKEKRLMVLAIKPEDSPGPPPPRVKRRTSPSTKAWYGPAFRKTNRPGRRTLESSNQ